MLRCKKWAEPLLETWRPCMGEVRKWDAELYVNNVRVFTALNTPYKINVITFWHFKRVFLIILWIFHTERWEIWRKFDFYMMGLSYTRTSMSLKKISDNHFFNLQIDTIWYCSLIMLIKINNWILRCLKRYIDTFNNLITL